MHPQPSFSGLLRRPVHLLAFGFGTGLARKAPGTVGTLAALPIYGLLHLLPVAAYVGTIIVLAGVGVWLCDRTARELGVHDHSGIVWDEIVGYLCAMIAVPATWLNVVAAFVLFRAFDVLKPWPVRWLDRRVPGGWGIMLDDIVAGLMALTVIQTVNLLPG